MRKIAQQIVEKKTVIQVVEKKSMYVIKICEKIIASRR
jgi:hypothetical protein